MNILAGLADAQIPLEGLRADWRVTIPIASLCMCGDRRFC